MSANTRPGRPIMVAIRSLDRAPRSFLRKAAAQATARGVGVRLVHIIALPYVSVAVAGARVRAAARAELEEAKARLREFTHRPELRGVATTSTVSWDYPAADGIVRQVLKQRPQLLLAESHRHGRFARLWLSNTDWELIRQCPCPLWLVKSARCAASGKVLAAVDPFHAHAKPASLDHVILRHAIDVAGGPVRRVLACHSYAVPKPVMADGVVEAYWLSMSDEQQEDYRASAHRAVASAAARHGIPAQNVLVVPGDPAYQLPRIARKHKIDVVVMGAVSRGGLKRIFIGQTAERVIDGLTCDVLIVKPRGFKTSVLRRARSHMTD